MTDTQATSFPELSQSPCFERKWPSLYEAFEDGRIEEKRLRETFLKYLPPCDPEKWFWIGADVSNIARARAVTSADRTAHPVQNLPKGMWSCSDFSDFLPPKRFALLVCLLHQATIATRNEIVQMFIKRMSKLTTKAKEELERLRKEDRTTTEHLIDIFTEVLQTNTETHDVTEAGTQVRKVLDAAGGTAQLLEQCEQVSAPSCSPREM